MWIALSPLKTCQVLAGLSGEGYTLAASASSDQCTEGLDFQVCQRQSAFVAYQAMQWTSIILRKEGAPFIWALAFTKRADLEVLTVAAAKYPSS